MAKDNFKVDFIGIGAPRCATTWIYKCLKEHPEICMSEEKEIGFFNYDNKYKRGIKYYRNFFSNCSAERMKGEFSVSYLHTPKTPARIYSAFPDVKLIASLRNPIERAYSHYRFTKNIKTRISGYDSLNEALTDEEFLRMGFYAHNLERYLQYFSKEDIKIILYRDIKNSPRKTIKSIYKFLGVNSDFSPPLINQEVNVTGAKRRKLKVNFLTKFLHKIRNRLKKGERLFSLISNSPLHTLHKKLIAWNRGRLERIDCRKKSFVENLDPETKKKLKQVYKDDIKKLEKMINEDLSYWK